MDDLPLDVQVAQILHAAADKARNHSSSGVIITVEPAPHNNYHHYLAQAQNYALQGAVEAMEQELTSAHKVAKSSSADLTAQSITITRQGYRHFAYNHLNRAVLLARRGNIESLEIALEAAIVASRLGGFAWHNQVYNHLHRLGYKNAAITEFRRGLLLMESGKTQEGDQALRRGSAYAIQLGFDPAEFVDRYLR